MTEYVIVSDIHGNAPSLEKVIEKEGVDSEYIILGDIHGLMAYPAKVVDIIQDLNTKVVLKGNHCRAIFHKGEGHVNDAMLSKFEYEHTMSALTQEQQDWVKELPYMDIFQDGDERICATHAMPWPEKASGYKASNAGITKRDMLHIASIVSDDYDWVMSGHTHTQYWQYCEKFGHDIHFLNPGSVGYNGEYAVVNPEKMKVKLKKVEYDKDRVKEHITAVLPEYAPSANQWF